MSWLFDRLCEIAVADCVEVTMHVATGPDAASAGATDLAEVLARASELPQMTVTVASTNDRGVPLTGIGLVDLDGCSGADRVDAIAAQLRRLGEAHPARLQVRRGELLLDDLPVQPVVMVPGGTVRHIVVTDEPDHGDALRTAADRGLAIAVGGTEPDANVRVEDLVGVASILDALVTLRHVAFTAPADAS